MFDAIRSETDADMVELHVRWLANTARAFEMPMVLTPTPVTATRVPTEAPSTQQIRTVETQHEKQGGTKCPILSMARAASRS